LRAQFKVSIVSQNLILTAHQTKKLNWLSASEIGQKVLIFRGCIFRSSKVFIFPFPSFYFSGFSFFLLTFFFLSPIPHTFVETYLLCTCLLTYYLRVASKICKLIQTFKLTWNIHTYKQYKYTSIQANKHTSIQSHIHTRKQTYKHSNTNTHMDTWDNLPLKCTHTLIHSYGCTYIQKYARPYLTKKNM